MALADRSGWLSTAHTKLSTANPRAATTERPSGGFEKTRRYDKPLRVSDRLFVGSSASRIATLIEHNGHDGHKGKPTVFALVSFVSFALIPRRDTESRIE
jgi:hypothetical protein